MIKQVVISAGGFGTRLRPTTDTMPKPMIPILGKPMLLWDIMQFKKHGVTEFFLTLHYLPDVVTDYFGDGSKFGVKMNYFVEKEPMGSAGAIKKFEPQLDQLFYFMYGDMITLMDYSKMAAAYATKKDPIGMQRMKKTDDYADADVAEVDGEGRFIKMHPKPHTEKYPNAYRTRGSFILDKKILTYIPDNTAFDLGKQLLGKVVAAHENFYSYESDDYSKGIDTMEKWKEVEKYLNDHGLTFPG